MLPMPQMTNIVQKIQEKYPSDSPPAVATITITAVMEEI